MESFVFPPKHVEYQGYLLPKFVPLVVDVNKHMQWIQDMDSRDSDILICTFPKSGTNWINEIVVMLLAGKADYSKTSKGQAMLEAQPSENIDSMVSPRLLNTHVPFQHIPKKHVQNGYKIIHVLRNPKDCAVSFFNHVKKDKFTNTDEFPGTWEEYILGYCQNKFSVGRYCLVSVRNDNSLWRLKYLYDGWFKYEKDWEKAKAENKVTNVHTIFYEDMKLSTVAEIKRLAGFLGVPYTDDLLHEIADKCSFDKMLKEASSKMDSEIFKLISTDGTNFIYRKGQVGDWKNWFTVAQNEMFDVTLEREMKDSTLKFTYEN